MPFSFVPCQNCNGTVQCCKSLTHLTHLIKLRFYVWCAKYLAFGTFERAATDALKLLFSLKQVTCHVHTFGIWLIEI